MSNSNTEKSNQPLALPSTEDSPKRELQINQTVKLDELGPLVINEDGTMSRVNNWHELSDIEKKTFNRLVLKRNKERLQKLKDQGIEPN